MLPMVAIAAMGQQPFEFNYAEPGRDVMINDMEWVDGGAVLVGTTADTSFSLPFGGLLFNASAEGATVDIRRLAGTSHHISPAQIHAASDGRMHVTGAYTPSPDSFSGFFHYGVSNDGAVLDSTFLTVSGTKKSIVFNSTIFNGNTVVLGGSVAYSSSYITFSHSYILQVDLDGQFVNASLIGTANGQAMRITRDITPFANGLLASYERWPQSPGAYALYGAHLELVDNWGGQAPHFNPIQPLDSIVKGAMSLLPVSDERYIVGGSFILGSPRYNAAAYIIGIDGETKAAFVPHSPYAFDMSAMQGCIADIDAQSFYFLAVENVRLMGSNPMYTPDEPNRLHVYKLDTGLNVLCDLVLDGFGSQTYYLANRIKATPDGGFVIMGAKKDMSVPGNQFTAWAQRFSAGDCTVGIGTLEASRHATVFPNPGRNGFEVLMNGSGLTRGKLALFDATGTLVGESGLAGNRAYMDCSHLADGLYLYRITDGRGQPYAAGRWVKQP